MSAFPIHCNVAHARRYGQSRSLRQMSEPNGPAVTKSVHQDESLGAPVKAHHYSADFPVTQKQHNEPHNHFAKFHKHEHKNVTSLARHMQRSLNLGHLGEVPITKPLLNWRSVSVDALVRNILPPSVIINKGSVSLESGESSFDDPSPTNIPNIDKFDLAAFYGKKGNGRDSGFGSAFNIGPGGNICGFGGVGLAATTSSFLKAQTDSIIDAVSSFAARNSQN